MVVTELRAHLAPDQSRVLIDAYRAATSSLGAEVVRTALLQSASDPTSWRILTTWTSRAALEEYRASVETPAGVLVFRSAGAEPELTILEVTESMEGTGT